MGYRIGVIASSCFVATIIIFALFALQAPSSLMSADALSIEAITPSEPLLRSEVSYPIGEVTVGQQRVITTTITNNVEDDMPFVAIIEVRSSDGVTGFLSWQGGMVKVEGKTEVGVSWIPADADTYDLRTFVISDLENPRVLSPVKNTLVTVVQPS